jgi:hypothetical protein
MRVPFKTAQVKTAQDYYQTMVKLIAAPIRGAKISIGSAAATQTARAPEP